MTRLTPLETAVLDALADELRFEIPDLSGQIAEALVGVRRNTGFGFFTEVIVDRNRPGVNIALSGRLGSIHGDVPGLVEPMAFQLEVAGGRLLALHGMTYDEPTDAIDFPTARVSGLFRINDQGRSIPWTPPPLLNEDSPLRVLQKSDEPYDAGSDPPPLRPRYTPLSSTPVTHVPAPTPQLDLPTDAVLVAGVMGALAVVGVIAVFLFRLPIFAAIVVFGYAASALRRPKIMAAIRKVVSAINAEGRT